MPYYRRRRRRGYARPSYGRHRYASYRRRGYSRGRRRGSYGRRRRSGAQRIVIQVVGGAAGGSVPISTHTLGSKGRRPLRSKY